MRRVIFVFILFVFAGTLSAQTNETPITSTIPTDAGVEDIYLAKDNGSGKAGDPVSSFVITDIPIFCVVQLSSTKPVTVKMNFVAVSVPGVKPDSKVVTVSYATKDGENRVNFKGRPADTWSPGKYRVDIFLDGDLAKGLVFEIRSAESDVGKAAYFQPKGVTKGKLTARTKRPLN